jgi:hypothetical protein
MLQIVFFSQDRFSGNRWYEWFNQRPEIKSNAGYRLAEGDASGKLTVGDEDAGRISSGHTILNFSRGR